MIGVLKLRGGDNVPVGLDSTEGTPTFFNLLLLLIVFEFAFGITRGCGREDVGDLAENRRSRPIESVEHKKIYKLKERILIMNGF